MAFTIKSLEVPVVQEDIPNHDWSFISSALGWPQSRPVEELNMQINPVETRYCTSSPTNFSASEFMSGIKLKDHFKSIPEFRWISDRTGDTNHHPEQTHSQEGKFMELLEPREMLQLGELHACGESPAAIRAHILGFIEHQQSSAEMKVECPYAVKVDFQLLANRCISKREYETVVSEPSTDLFDVVERINITDYRSRSGTDDIQEIPTSDKALHTFEEPLFDDKVLSMTTACMHSLSCGDEVTVGRIPFERSSDGLGTVCFENLIVIPELRMDDQQFQSIPTPTLTESSSDELKVAIVTGVFSKSKPSPMTATDWLYLDWHFAQGRTCNNAKCFKLQAKLEENNKPTQGFTAIRMNASHWSKVALKLVELENVPRRSVINMSEEYPMGAKHLIYDSHSAQEKHSFVSQEGRDAYNGLSVTASTGEPAKTADSCGRTVEKEYSESRRVDVQEAGADFSVQDILTPSRSFPTNRDFRESLQNNAADAVAGEKLTFKLPGLHDAEQSSRDRASHGSVLDDLACFVQTRKGVLPNNFSSRRSRADCEENSRKIMNKVILSEITSVDGGERTFSSFEHAVDLSPEIKSLLAALASDYHNLILLKEIFGKDKVVELNIPGKFGFDSRGNTRVMTLVKTIASEQPTQQRQVLLRGIIALHVLRQTGLNLCIYGIQVAHLFLENLFDRIRFLEELILHSRVELEDAYNKVERGIYQDHPKLDHLQTLLKGRNSSHKILLIADRRAYFTLYKKLLSSGFNPYQIDRKEQYLRRGVILPGIATKLREEIIAALSFSNCLLVPCAYITDSFPIENFTMVIQYGYTGTYATAEEVLQRGRCERHILKDSVNPEESNTSAALETALVKSDENLISEQPQVFNRHGPLADKILMLLETTDKRADPQGIEETNHWEVNREVNCHLSTETFDPTPCNLEKDRRMPTPSWLPDGSITKDHMKATESNNVTETRYEMILVANVSQESGNKLVQRRSSYQKVLCLEKQNIQVVERELRIPADLLLTPAICLVIYTRAMLAEKLQSFQQGPCSLRTEVEIVVKAITFAYRNCILIFEGPSDFTSAVLDVLCDIHAMAIRFELQVQCFISNGEGITDKIIMKCIEAARRTKLLNLYPAMTETPTIAEAFLTEFPAINPLSAHAILSSGCPLRTFFSLSLDQQYALVHNSDVPRRSLELFRAQCAHREIRNSIDSSRLDFGSVKSHDTSKLDGRKNASSPSCEGLLSLTGFVRDRNLIFNKDRGNDLYTDLDLSVREPVFEPWDSSHITCEAHGDSRVKNSIESVSFVGADSFPEFPPASEVKNKTPKDLSLNGRTFGHHFVEDQDFQFFLPDRISSEISTPQDTSLPFLLPTRRYGGQEKSFLTSLGKLKASLSGGDQQDSDRECRDFDKQGKCQQSCRSVDCSSPPTSGMLASSGGGFHRSTNEEVGQEVALLSSTFNTPSTSKGKLLQTSLDRYRYQPRNSEDGTLSTSWKFPKINSRKKETPVPTPRSSSILIGVPVDKRSKKLLGLTRRGSDRQQRLAWINRKDDTQEVCKRQKKDQTYNAK